MDPVNKNLEEPTNSTALKTQPWRRHVAHPPTRALEKAGEIGVIGKGVVRLLEEVDDKGQG